MQLILNHTLHKLSGGMEHRYLNKSYELYKSKANVIVTDIDLRWCSLASGKIMRAARLNQLGMKATRECIGKFVVHYLLVHRAKTMCCRRLWQLEQQKQLLISIS